MKLPSFSRLPVRYRWIPVVLGTVFGIAIGAGILYLFFSFIRDSWRSLTVPQAIVIAAVILGIMLDWRVVVNNVQRPGPK